MTKAAETGLFIGLLSFLWTLAYFGLVPLPAKVQAEIVPVLPWWSLVAFGSYALFTLGYDVVTFNDKPEKFKQLKEQITLAKRELRAQGVPITD